MLIRQRQSYFISAENKEEVVEQDVGEQEDVDSVVGRGRFTRGRRGGSGGRRRKSIRS